MSLKKSGKWKEFKKVDSNVLKSQLTDIQYKVTQKDGTEKPFENEYWNNTAAGIYVDIVSGEPLFLSLHKYKSGTGWPSFSQTLKKQCVVEKKDRTLFFAERTEVRSAMADSHLGHVFNDGPGSEGLRYCINSAALNFIPLEKMECEGYSEFLHFFQPSVSG